MGAPIFESHLRLMLTWYGECYVKCPLICCTFVPPKHNYLGTVCPSSSPKEWHLVVLGQVTLLAKLRFRYLQLGKRQKLVAACEMAEVGDSLGNGRSWWQQLCAGAQSYWDISCSLRFSCKTTINTSSNKWRQRAPRWR